MLHLLLLLSSIILRPAFCQNCSICEGDQTVLDPLKPLNKGGTCGEVEELVGLLSVDLCEEQATNIIVWGIRCGAFFCF
jgi:hypothetical protein